MHDLLSTGRGVFYLDNDGRPERSYRPRTGPYSRKLSMFLPYQRFRPIEPDLTRGVHGNGKDWDPMGPMGFPWEWEYDQSWEWDGNGISRMGMGIKT